MIETLPLFAAADASAADPCRRSGGNHESTAAFRAGDKAKDREMVYRAIRARGAAGATLDEISTAFGRPPNALSGRVVELREAGRIVRTVERRRTRTGCSAAVYRAVE